MDVHLRPARMDEVPALRALIEQSVRGLGAADYTPQQVESGLRYIFGVDTQLVHDGTYFVAEAGGAVVGCGGWSRRRALYGGDQTKLSGDEDDLLDPARDAARIRAFFVHPAWARRGVGSRLMEACERAARAAGFTRLELGSTLTGVPLYATFGFEAVETETRPLPDGVVFPVVTMRKALG